ncbi:unnamed protein product [Rotaria sp. Silwood2]|nr:unnamed protein product [Rotaria sp. Silwood2]
MTYFGTNAVPSIFILRKNKLLARLNSTNDIQILISLIESTLHLNQTNNVTIEYEDRIGPVTTIFEPSFDYALLFSWLFVGLFIYYYAEKYNLLTIIRQRFSHEN